MNFAELYKNNRIAVEKTMLSMWCGESSNDSQASYIAQLRKLIGDLFAPHNAEPVVQCMNSYLPVHSVTAAEAEAIVGNLWRKTLPKGKYYAPYEHQYLSWDNLLRRTVEIKGEQKPKSICVTTGTGSGKTECFMLPLVYDLLQQGAGDVVQSRTIKAIFLYPLNALMEDQKERLEQLLEGTNLTYTVYNGDLPENEPKADDNSTEANRLRARIKQLRGEYVDEATGETKYRFGKMLYTRRQVRQTPPDILLTNPTMLEYILLRGTDAALIDPKQQSLRWVAIDETHTYTGAGAAELALLLRRVLLAFNVDAADVRFATSSATFGNTDDPEKAKEETKKLRKFIAGITGLSTKQVEVIGGKRVGEDNIPHGEDEQRWKTIFAKDFVPLNELFPETADVETQLRLVDEMCEREEVRYRAAGQPVPDMKLKVHYFYRVPNNGLFVRLTEHADGSFRIYTQTPNDGNEVPLLELSRCKNCGEYVAVGMVDTNEWKYKSVAADDSDMFDLPDPDDEDGDLKYIIFALSNQANSHGDNNVKFKVDGDQLIQVQPGEIKPGEWHVVGNTQCRCPYCNSKQSRARTNEKDMENDASGNLEDTRMMKFRLSADFISRLLAPSVLDQLDKAEPPTDGSLMLHDGQQFISFVDSRQAAAKATLKQNLEQERMWLYSTIYTELCRRKAEAEKQKKIVDELTKKMRQYDDDSDEYEALFQQRKKERAKLKDSISWMEIAELLKNDRHCKTFCSQFIKRSSDSDELNDDGTIPDIIVRRYVQSIMMMYLAKHLTSAASFETMGLFQTCYPQLMNIKELPKAVEQFNELMENEANTITLEDWRNLIQVFIDYNIRSNQSFFLRINDTDPIDIFKCQRFATERPRRRPARKPVMEEGKLTQSRVARYLCQLIVRDDNTMTLNDAYNEYFCSISNVVDALWETVQVPENKILETATNYDEDDARHVPERGDVLRMNLTNISFKLYENVYLCDTTSDSADRHTFSLRPIENNFKHFSPYLSGGIPVNLDENLHEHWAPYPYYHGSASGEPTPEKLEAWAKENRKLLYEHNLWGNDGVFADRLYAIHLIPKLFIQAEHTAQVDKAIARKMQLDFKKHLINILACSTTMEMGVDLGNLEVVMLSSVPPMPSNYKQRAGRSGRNNKVRSVCITLCGSDAIGLRTLYNPIPTIISRPVEVPSVDLKSPQVVQRHVNSFLVRAFGVFTEGAHGGSLNQKVVDYFTPFRIEITPSGFKEIVDQNNATVSPDQMLGEPEGTMYELFNRKCSEPLSEDLRSGLTALLDGTIFEGQLNYVVQKAAEHNRRCYSELSLKLEDYAVALRTATNTRFRNKLKWQYFDELNARLITYWATHRFSPNANMPVNVLSLDLDPSGKRDYVNSSSSSNPTYSLREAIAQYAPGNAVVVDGVVYTVRGVQTSSQYQDARVFMQIYHNRNKTVIDDANALDHMINWPVNDDKALTLIQPAAFMPDINEDKTRILDNNVYTHVSAQLIDTDDWTSGPKDPHLFSVRSNRDTGYAKILYYNEGQGFGYCYCQRCGRAVIETEVADRENPLKLPHDMNPVFPRDPDKPRFHYVISGKDVGQRRPCHGSYDPSLIRRNVIIGGLIQTDFAEIRLRHKGSNSWISERDAETNLLFTLGVVFTQALVEHLGKERGAVDFAIMPNGHLCVFDTNPGGAGYANQLSSVVIMNAVVKIAKRMLLEAKQRNTKDVILDKFTLRFMKYIDIDLALAWIQEEEESAENLPKEIAALLPNAHELSIQELERAFRKASTAPTLFVTNDFSTWNYSDAENSWRGQHLNNFAGRGLEPTFCIAAEGHAPMNVPIIQMVQAIKGWTKDVKIFDNPFAAKGVYPIAYIDGMLYVTNNAEFASLNDKWANETMYCAQVENPAINAVSVDTSPKPTTKIFRLSGNRSRNINSKTLGAIIQENAQGIVEQFLAHCKQHKGKIEVFYQDEHLKSVLAIVLALQTVEHFVKLIGKDFSLSFKIEKYDEPNMKPSIQAALAGSYLRDQYLKDIAEQWLEDFNDKHGDRYEGTLQPIVSQNRRTLTHWRELTISFAGKKLSIYPDGGFLNGWKIGQNNRFFTNDDTSTADNIELTRTEDIKYDVAIEDVE